MSSSRLRPRVGSLSAKGLAGISVAALTLGSLVVGLMPSEAAAVEDPESAATASPSVAEVDFVEGTVPASYFEAGPVPEEVGDQQQIVAVTGGQTTTVSEDEAAGENAAGLEEETGHADAVDEDVALQQRSARAIEGEVDVNIVRADLEADNALLAATWSVDEVAPQSVHLRYLLDGAWSEWTQLDIADDADDPDMPITRAGTDPFSVFFADAAEVVAVGEDGQTIPGLTLVVIDAESDGEIDNALADLAPVEEPEAQIADDPEVAEPEVAKEETQDEVAVEETEVVEETPEESPKGDLPLVPEDVLLDLDGAAVGGEAAYFGDPTAAATVIPTALNAAGTVFDTGFQGLKINTRRGWGANEKLMTWTPKSNNIKGTVIHHTESSNNYTQAQTAQQIRNIYEYHARTLGWGDIGYNVIVDRFGGVWEGRAGGLTKMIHAAHAGNANGATFGISVMGGFMTSAPSAATQDSLAKTIAWKMQLHGIKSISGNISVLHQSGEYVTVPVVSGHRDVGWTDCPGNALYKQLGSVRTKISNYLKSGGASSGGASSGGSVSGVTTGLPATFSAGNVIGDALFYNNGAMTEAQIKAKIQEAGASCRPGSGTTCLKDTKFPTTNLKTLRGGCKALNMSGSQAPWTIIKKTADACGLNPQVILTTLQKEQSGMVQPKSAAVWAKAMGAGCPDNSACDPAKSGFQKQVYYGADKLVSYKLQSQAGHVDAFKAGKAMTVKHNADAKCGSQSVKFSNVATASLYEYTPYIGNSSVSGCGPTGQKTFYDIYKRYFPQTVGGATTAPPAAAPPITWQARVQIGHGWGSGRVVYAGDWNRSGYTDLMMIDSAGNLWWYQGRAGQKFAYKQKIGNGWSGMDWVQGGVDWDGDGNLDLIARQKSTGDLYLYPGNGKGGFKAKQKIGSGWNAIGYMALTRTAKGPAVYAVSGGRFYYYPSNGRGGFASKQTLGTGWQNFNQLAAVGDWNGDGIPDMLARHNNGDLYLYAGKSDGTPGAATKVGNGWQVMRAMGVANQSAAKKPVWAVDSSGILWSYGIK